MARTFKLFPYDEKTIFHMEKALESGRRRVRIDPENSHAVYRLGQAYLFKGERSAALVQLEKAVSLNPNSKRYKDTLKKVRSEASVYFNSAGKI